MMRTQSISELRGFYLIKYLPLLIGLVGCAPTYSPNVYSFDAAQQLAKVEHGVVVGVRPVWISPDTADWAKEGILVGGTGGTLIGDTRGALGGVAGEAVGMGLGGVVGTGVAHLQGDVPAFEYIVQVDKNQVSVAQAEKLPLRIGLHVMIIEGKQARIVEDYVE